MERIRNELDEAYRSLEEEINKPLQSTVFESLKARHDKEERLKHLCNQIPSRRAALRLCERLTEALDKEAKKEEDSLIGIDDETMYVLCTNLRYLFA